MLCSVSLLWYCRLDLSEDSVRERERYAAKEREEVVRREKEEWLISKLNNRSWNRLPMTASKLCSCWLDSVCTKAHTYMCCACTCTLYVFCRARRSKGPAKGTLEVTKSLGHSPPLPVAEKASTTSSTPGPTDICRVQVRLPNGKVVRHNFPPSASLDDVTTFVMEKKPHYSSVILVQVHVACEHMWIEILLSLSVHTQVWVI